MTADWARLPYGFWRRSRAVSSTRSRADRRRHGRPSRRRRSSGSDRGRAHADLPRGTSAFADLEHDEARARPPRCAAPAGRGACNGERAAAGRERDASLAEGEREGRGALHLSPRGRTPPPCSRGAINARAPSADIPQVRFAGTTVAGQVPKREVLGGASRTAAGRTAAASTDARRRMQGPDGTYWTVQAWQRRPLLGFDPWLPTMRTGSSTSRTSPASFLGSNSIPTGRDGRWQGRLRPLQLPRPAGVRYGSTAKCRRTSTAAISTSTRSTRTGPGGGAVGHLTHRGTGTFCHSFVPSGRYLSSQFWCGRQRRRAASRPSAGPASQSQAESQGSRNRTGAATASSLRVRSVASRRPNLRRRAVTRRRHGRSVAGRGLRGRGRLGRGRKASRRILEDAFAIPTSSMRTSPWGGDDERPGSA